MPKKIKITKRDIVWMLILLNVIIWAISYNTCKNFYEHYLELEMKAAEAKNGAVVVETAAPQLAEGSMEWIKQQWEAAGADWEKVWAITQIESGWDNNAWRCNSPGSSIENKTSALDVGYYQLNSIHKIPLSCAVDPVCSTQKAIELWKEQGWTPWKSTIKKLNL